MMTPSFGKRGNFFPPFQSNLAYLMCFLSKQKQVSIRIDCLEWQ